MTNVRGYVDILKLRFKSFFTRDAQVRQLNDVLETIAYRLNFILCFRISSDFIQSAISNILPKNLSLKHRYDQNLKMCRRS